MLLDQPHSGPDLHLVKKGDVQGETEAIPKVDLIGQSVAQLAGSGGRVGQKSLGGSIHERHWKHDGLFGLCGLKEKKKFLFVVLLF